MKTLVRRAEQVAQYFARKRGITPEEYRRKLDARFGKGRIRCPNCGLTNMLLIRIWSKHAGLVYELTREGLRTRPVTEDRPTAPAMPILDRQLALAF